MHSPGSSTESVPALIYSIDSILTRIDLSSLFPSDQPLEVELGSGDGSFLVAYATAHRDRNFIGIERLLGRLRKIERKGRQAGLTNLRAARIESAYFLQYLLPPHQTTALHIYFPDPWPKRKHRRHGLINESFVLLAHQALKPRGRIFLRTDDQDYFEQIIRVFSANDSFREIETPLELAELQTDFEAEFSKRGIATLRAAYESCSRD